MLKRILLIAVIISQVFAVNAQLNVNLIGQLTFPGHGNLNDVWGYVDGAGNEYALVGTENGTSIVDISNPSSPVEVFFTSGPTTIWRDLKVWGDHAYITNESSGGMKIIDMSNLPGAITAGDVYNYTGSTYQFSSAHDLYIDENGVAYVIGADNGNGGAIMLDLTANPQAPVELGRYNDYYLHDAMVRGDTLWGGAINDGFFVAVDVSNKSAPITMQTQNTPNTFTHNCWISDDGHTLFTTDEVSNAFIGAYDVSNLSNISELDRIQSSPGQNVIVHNTFVIGNYIVTSYYRDGITIHDVSNPSNMVEVGNYDTSPAFSGGGFNGCWGVYPWLPSGLIIATDIENGLYVLGPTYTPASYLDGNVIDSVTTSSLDAVQVDIVATTTSTNTNILGDYQTGLATAGTYSVTYSKFGYETKTFNGVVLTSGNTTTLNVELKALVSFTLQGQVIEASSANPIPNANVKIWSPIYTTTVQTDAGGNFTVPNFIEGFYKVYIGKWAYNQLCLGNENLSAAGNTHVYQLVDGYYDDFTFDLGWTVSGNPNTGDWEKGIPNGTTSGGNPSNPGIDSQTDCSDEAYVTGNGGGSAASDDIDGGETVLTSPMFDLTTYGDPYIHFDRWFYNGGGNGNPNDSLVVTLTNGSVGAIIDFADINDPDLSAWASKGVQVSSVMTPTSTMQLIVRAMDIGSGHLSEGGFDKFLVADSLTTGTTIAEVIEEKELSIYPAPFKDELNISLPKSIELVKIEVYDITGKMIDNKEFNNTSIVRFTNNYKQGVYLINVYGNGALIKTQKIIKL
ncbi:MAG: choice-of-anchor B family protein [Flavobacteriales bacterium]|nr:choice-of-anchor B family protein [Flavobacteriales bacterium]